MPLDPLAFCALLCGGLFAGVLLYTTAIAHPARLSLGLDHALRSFLASVNKSDPIQPALHVVCLGCTVAMALRGDGVAMWVAVAVMAPVLPLSIGLAKPLNRQLKRKGLLANLAEADKLLRLWHRVHRARSIFGIASYVALLAAVLSS